LRKQKWVYDDLAIIKLSDREMTLISVIQNRENSHVDNMREHANVPDINVVNADLLVRKRTNTWSFRQSAIRSASNDRLKFYTGSHCKY